MKANKLFMLAMGLVAVGCNESQIEEQSLINDAQGEAVEVVLDASVNNEIGSQSKAVSGINDGAVFIEFDETDAIGVYLNNEKNGLTHENVKFTVKEVYTGEDGYKHATFTTDQPMILLGKGNNVYAYYPYAATDTEFEGSSRSTDRGAWDGYHHFNIPAEQELADSLGDYSNLTEYVHLYARERKLDKVGNKVVVADPGLQFRHAFAYVTLNVKNTYDRAIDIASARVKFFKGGKPVAIAGDFAVALDELYMVETEGLEAVVAGENVQYAVTVKAPTADGLELAGETSSWIPVAIAPATLDEFEVAVTTVDGFVYKKTVKWSSEKTIPQNYSQPIDLDLSDATLSSEVVNSEVAEYMLHMDKEHIVLDLAAHITLNINPTSRDAWGTANTKTITINDASNGTLVNGAGMQTTPIITFNYGTNPDLAGQRSADGKVKLEYVYNDVDVVNPDAVVKFNDVQLKTSNAYAASQLYHTLVFDCKVEMKNVLTWTSMLARRSATFNTVVFTDLHNSSNVVNYGLWLQPTVEEQVVTLDGGCNIFSAAANVRGIKIDNDTNYAEWNLGEPQKVKLNVSNTSFMTAKKAAILVRTKTGAEINIGTDVNIAGVADDQVNHIWIDEETADYASLVTVKNARWKIEGKTWSALNDANGNVVTAYADDQAGLEGAYAHVYNVFDPNDLSSPVGGVVGKFIEKIQLADGDYTLPAFTATNARKVQLEGTRDAVVNVDVKKELENVELRLKGITLTNVNASGAGKAGQYITTNLAVSYEDVLFKNALIVKSTSKFIDCEFDYEQSTSEYVQILGAKTVTFDKCVFNTKGRAIYVYGDSASEVGVFDCDFNAVGSWKAPDLINTSCAAIDINNAYYNKASKPGISHNINTKGNKWARGFFGEWRIANYVAVAEGAKGLYVNGVKYEQIAADGSLLYVHSNGSVQDYPEE